MHYFLSIETIILDREVFQNFIFYNKEWYDEQYKLNLIRKLIINQCKLDLEWKSSQIKHLTTTIKYNLSNENENVNRFDGGFFYGYRKPKFKGCLNCLSYDRGRRFCSWKDRILLSPARYCDGFLQK